MATANTPVVRMATSVSLPQAGQIAGVLRVGASYSVRGRQLDDITTAESLARDMLRAGIHMQKVSNCYQALGAPQNN